MKRQIELLVFWICFILGIGIFLYLLGYFIVSGYFGRDFGLLHLFSPSIRADFPLIIYSLLFSCTCVLFIKKQKYFIPLCQFVLIGLLIDFFWKAIESYIVEYYFTLNDYNLMHIITILCCIVLLKANRQNKKCTMPIKRLIIMIGINIALITIKYVVPQYRLCDFGEDVPSDTELQSIIKQDYSIKEKNE